MSDKPKCPACNAKCLDSGPHGYIGWGCGSVSDEKEFDQTDHCLIRQLGQLVLKYGEHREGCDFRNSAVGPVPLKTCDCGWDAVQTAIIDGKRPPRDSAIEKTAEK